MKPATLNRVVEFLNRQQDSLARQTERIKLPYRKPAVKSVSDPVVEEMIRTLREGTK